MNIYWENTDEATLVSPYPLYVKIGHSSYGNM